MRKIRNHRLVLSSGALLLIWSFAACAAAPQRTFVSTAGNDTNPCSLTLPCRGFTAAMAAVATGGEIVVIDSGGYGAVTINKSVSIVAPPGVYAGVAVFPAATGSLSMLLVAASSR